MNDVRLARVAPRVFDVYRRSDDRYLGRIGGTTQHGRWAEDPFGTLVAGPSAVSRPVIVSALVRHDREFDPDSP